ncbi:uncharacterized protein LOC110012705 [Sesamum indicum]|uniref:Uncharacterized protein LOC110012705 n=1 Tax=Sesamum indicum TaxID=4182 RepID=A0A8M8V9L4_SESIN|nr:uncharacterized protein LOC110012705 [Sesamum indicum]
MLQEKRGRQLEQAKGDGGGENARGSSASPTAEDHDAPPPRIGGFGDDNEQQMWLAAVGSKNKGRVGLGFEAHVSNRTFTSPSPPPSTPPLPPPSPPRRTASVASSS